MAEDNIQTKANQLLNAWFDPLPSREKIAALEIIEIICSDDCPDKLRRIMYDQTKYIWPTFPAEELIKLSEFELKQEKGENDTLV